MNAVVWPQSLRMRVEIAVDGHRHDGQSYDRSMTEKALPEASL
jgi:hypothetical protein